MFALGQTYNYFKIESNVTYEHRIITNVIETVLQPLSAVMAKYCGKRGQAVYTAYTLNTSALTAPAPTTVTTSDASKKSKPVAATTATDDDEMHAAAAFISAADDKRRAGVGFAKEFVFRLLELHNSFIEIYSSLTDPAHYEIFRQQLFREFASVVNSQGVTSLLANLLNSIMVGEWVFNNHFSGQEQAFRLQYFGQ
jgi:hypothetical protein